MDPEQFLEFSRFVNAPLMLITSKGDIKAVNREFSAAFGLGQERIRGGRLDAHVSMPADDVAAFLKSCSRTREMIPARLVLRTATGEEVACLVEGSLCTPRSGDAPASLVLRFQPPDERQKSFVILNKKIQELTAEIGRRKILEKERVQILSNEQTARAEAERARRDAERARAEAERASRAKDEFLAAVSHELRTPMGVIMGWLELIITRSIDESEYDSAFLAIQRNAKSQLKLITDLLEMSRLVSGKSSLNLKPVSLVTVVENAVESIRPAAEARRIQLHLQLSPTAGMVLGDADRLQQAVWNLLANAVKFSRKESSVCVLLRRSNSRVELSVRDEGEGIDKDFLPFVFERFLQEDGSKSRVHGGLGLGLAIVRHVIESHGGTATAFSAGKGFGSTFTITLPLSAIDIGTDFSEGRARAPQPPQEDETTPVEDLSGFRIIVVDDEPDARDLIARILRGFGAEVVTAASAKEALERLCALNADVLLSDIGMPVENGYELIRNVRRLDASLGGRIPAAALTAFASREDRYEALASGFQEHLSKPVTTEDLVRVVATLARTSLSTKH